MRLELQTPPTLVSVEIDGRVLPALLLARRGERRYVQVCSGPGCNALRWVDAVQLRAPDGSAGTAAGAPPRGLAWVRPRHGR